MIECTHCDNGATPDCDQHCSKSNDGKHAFSWDAASISNDGPRFYVDVKCRNCGFTGSAMLKKDDIWWEA